MRKNAALLERVALIAGLLLIAGITGVSRARAAAEQRPWLGVYMQELTSELSEGMDYKGEGGVIVSRVVPDGPADRAGVRSGDVIVRIDSRAVSSPVELQDVVRAARVGQIVSLEVFRDGERRNLSVRLAERPVGQEGGGESIEEPETPGMPGMPGHKRVIIRDLGGRNGLEGLDLPGGTELLGATPHGRLGVRIESLSPQLGSYFSLRDGKGVLVLEVLKGTPAERAGLEPGDVITRAGNEAVANARDLVGALWGKEGKVALRVVRHGTPRTIEAELEKEAPGSMRTFDQRLGDRPGVQKRIILRGTERGDLRHELDQLKQQLDELRQRLDEQQGDEGGD